MTTHAFAMFPFATEADENEVRVTGPNGETVFTVCKTDSHEDVAKGLQELLCAVWSRASEEN